MVNSADFVVWLKDIEREDKIKVGDTLAILGEFVQSKIPVASGFIIAPYAFKFFLEENKLPLKIRHLLGTVNPERPDSVMQISSHIQKLILSSPFPKKLSKEIFDYYDKLLKIKSKNVLLTSFTNFLIEKEIKGEAALIELVRIEWSKAFHLTTIFEEIVKFPVLLVSQKLTPQIKGKVFTIDPDSGERGVIRVEQDVIRKYHVNKKSLEIYKKEIVNIILSEGEKLLNEEQVKKLSEIALSIEKLVYFPQEVDFIIENDNIFITNTKPLTHRNQEQIMAKILLHGTSAYRGIGIGNIKLIKSDNDLHSISSDDIVVIKHILPSDHSFLKKAKALIVEDSTSNSDSAIFARSWGIPTIIGAIHALKTLQDGAITTVHATRGIVFEGSITSYQYDKN